MQVPRAGSRWDNQAVESLFGCEIPFWWSRPSTVTMGGAERGKARAAQPKRRHNRLLLRVVAVRPKIQGAQCAEFDIIMTGNNNARGAPGRQTYQSIYRGHIAGLGLIAMLQGYSLHQVAETDRRVAFGGAAVLLRHLTGQKKLLRDDLRVHTRRHAVNMRPGVRVVAARRRRRCCRRWERRRRRQRSSSKRSRRGRGGGRARSCAAALHIASVVIVVAMPMRSTEVHSQVEVAASTTPLLRAASRSLHCCSRYARPQCLSSSGRNLHLPLANGLRRRLQSSTCCTGG